MTVQKCYDLLGSDYTIVLKRLQSEQLTLRLLKLFLEDPSFSHLEEALKKQDLVNAFRAAHTLKGVCANMGITKLETTAAALTEALRENDQNQNLSSLFEAAKKEYHAAKDVIETFLLGKKEATD